MKSKLKIFKNFSLIILFSLIVYNCKTDIKLKNKTEFKAIQVDTTLLFGIWGIHIGGDAAFRITDKDFYVVDFFETSTYSLQENKLIIHNSNHYNNGIIKSVTKDTLKIKWEIADDVSHYWRFKN